MVEKITYLLSFPCSNSVHCLSSYYCAPLRRVCLCLLSTLPVAAVDSKTFLPSLLLRLKKPSSLCLSYATPHIVCATLTRTSFLLHHHQGSEQVHTITPLAVSTSISPLQTHISPFSAPSPPPRKRHKLYSRKP